MIRIFLSLVAVAVVCVPSIHAQGVSTYLEDEADGAVRVEISGIPVPLPPQTLWERIQTLLGTRKDTKYRPEIGTVFTVNSSAYASSPYQTDSTPCITAVGTRVRPGVVASNFLPIGTVLEVNGLKFIVEDRMNARYDGYFVDLWFSSTSQALEFGRKSLEITVVGYEEPGTNVRAVATVDTDEEEVTVDTVPKPGIWETVKVTFSSLTNLLGARVSQDVNRYDVDCLAEEEAAATDAQ